MVIVNISMVQSGECPTYSKVLRVLFRRWIPLVQRASRSRRQQTDEGLRNIVTNKVYHPSSRFTASIFSAYGCVSFVIFPI